MLSGFGSANVDKGRFCSDISCSRFLDDQKAKEAKEKQAAADKATADAKAIEAKKKEDKKPKLSKAELDKKVCSSCEGFRFNSRFCSEEKRWQRSRRRSSAESKSEWQMESGPSPQLPGRCMNSHNERNKQHSTICATVGGVAHLALQVQSP